MTYNNFNLKLLLLNLQKLVHFFNIIVLVHILYYNPILQYSYYHVPGFNVRIYFILYFINKITFLMNFPDERNTYFK